MAQLPVYFTALVGRSDELPELVQLLRTTRLLSLVGPGGSGKTRLAAAVASELEGRHRGAVAWIDLGALRDPALVDRHVAAAVGLREQPGRAPAEALIELIGHTPTLLVLDNCEHLLGACAVLVDTLLRGCPALRILTTSRQATGIAGEKAWQVPPLAVPGAADPAAADSGAVQLFVERARDVVPEFALTPANTDAVVRICRRLDGLPLAIELAAARVKLLPPEQLASRLDGAFGLLASGSQLVLPRHRTLRALIDWSYHLLSPDERVLLERLSVFIGGFTLDAAERLVAFGAVEAGGVLDLLAALVDKSLVTMREWQGEARYTLLETVRRYADERLRASAEGEADPEQLDELRRRHAAYFVDFAEQSAVHLRRARQLEWLARIDAEHDNLRAALRWSIDAGDVERALRLCVGLRDFWRVRGHLSEGRQWVEEALGLAGGPDALRARALVGLAIRARMQGDHETFMRIILEGEALARRVCDRLALADALTQLGVGMRERGEMDTARERLDEAISLWRELEDARGLALALGIRSSLAMAQSDVGLARALRLEAVEVSRRAGDAEGEAHGLIGLGEVARFEGDLEGARAHNERSLLLFQQLGDSWQAAAVYQNLGWVAAEAGRLDEAERAFGESIALFRPSANRVGLTLCLYGLARVLHEHGETESAATALAAAAAQEAPVTGQRAAPADRLACDRTVATVEGALDADRLARARQVAAEMDLARGIEWVQAKLRARPGARALGSPAADRASAAAGVERRAVRAQRPDESATPDLRVRSLGPLQISLGDQPIEGDRFGSTKPRELLVFLLCHPNGCTREQVGVAFWPESSAVQVKNSFHVTLHRLRKALDRPEWIVVSGDRYHLDPALVVDFDAGRFESAVAAALRERRAAEAIAGLAAALALYQGDFLDGEMAGDWHLETRDDLHRLYLEGLLAYAKHLQAADRLAEASEALRKLLVRDPLNEEGCRQLMLCHERTGQRVQALRIYENLSVLLRTEMDTEPDETTQTLYRRLQQGEPVLHSPSSS